MAYKIGFVLSLLFVVQLFVLLGDLMAVQIIYTNLDAVSVSVGYVISQKGGITEEAIQLVENEAHATIEAVGDYLPMFGSLFEYKIAYMYDPLFISNEPMEIAVVRSVVIGYYMA